MKSPQFVLVAIASCALAFVRDCKTLFLMTYCSFVRILMLNQHAKIGNLLTL